MSSKALVFLVAVFVIAAIVLNAMSDDPDEMCFGKTSAMCGE